MSLKTQWFALIAALVCLAHCAQIDDFSTPYMTEVYTGALTITPSVEGIHPGADASTVITITGDKSGEQVSINGLPKNDGFEVLPKSNPLDFNLQAPIVSGLVAEVIDKTTIKVTGFKRQNDSAEDLELKVTGTLIREGPKFTTSPQDPIVIRGRLKGVLRTLPEKLKAKIVRKKDGKHLSELDENSIVPLYQIQFVGNIITIL
jgi:hypothetical protein